MTSSSLGRRRRSLRSAPSANDARWEWRRRRARSAARCWSDALRVALIERRHSVLAVACAARAALITRLSGPLRPASATITLRSMPLTCARYPSFYPAVTRTRSLRGRRLGNTSKWRRILQTGISSEPDRGPALPVAAGCQSFCGPRSAICQPIAPPSARQGRRGCPARSSTRE